jgi:hypothetical protein
MEMSGHLHFPVALPRERTLVPIGGWTGPSAGWDFSEKRKTFAPPGNGTPAHRARSLVTILILIEDIPLYLSTLLK